MIPLMAARVMTASMRAKDGTRFTAALAMIRFWAVARLDDLHGGAGDDYIEAAVIWTTSMATGNDTPVGGRSQSPLRWR